jgi:hypothetical protein
MPDNPNDKSVAMEITTTNTKPAKSAPMLFMKT